VVLDYSSKNCFLNTALSRSFYLIGGVGVDSGPFSQTCLVRLEKMLCNEFLPQPR
jgi:hypothetical protein